MNEGLLDQKTAGVEVSEAPRWGYNSLHSSDCDSQPPLLSRKPLDIEGERS